MSDGVKFEVQYSESEFVRGMIRALTRTSRSWLTIGLTTMGAFVGFGLVHWILVREAGPINTADLVIAAVAVPLSVGVAFALERFRLSLESAYTKMYRNNAIVREEFIVNIDQNGIESNSPSFSSSVKWQAFVEAFESDDDFFFMVSRDQPCFFPKRAFTPDQMMQVRKIATEAIGPRAKFLH